MHCSAMLSPVVNLTRWSRVPRKPKHTACFWLLYCLLLKIGCSHKGFLGSSCLRDWALVRASPVASRAAGSIAISHRARNEIMNMAEQQLINRAKHQRQISGNKSATLLILYKFVSLMDDIHLLDLYTYSKVVWERLLT